MIKDIGVQTASEKDVQKIAKRLLQHRRAGHYPTMSDICDDCLRAKMRDKPARRQDPAAAPEGSDKGWVAQVDYFGPMPPCLEGCEWGMVAVEEVTRWGHCHTMKTKASTGAREGLQQFRHELRHMSGHADRPLVRVHSDEGTELTLVSQSPIGHACMRAAIACRPCRNRL